MNGMMQELGRSKSPVGGCSYLLVGFALSNEQDMTRHVYHYKFELP